MYYDDQTRRFNLLSGLAFGALLGAGVGLLLPVAPSRARHSLRRLGRAPGRIARFGR